MAEEAERAMARDEPTLELVEQVLASLARRVSRAPRAAVLRVTGHWSRLSHSGAMPDEPRGFGEVFNDILRYAKERGDLPAGVETFELAALLQAATMDALVRWAATEQDEQVLAATLRRRAEVVLRGAAARSEEHTAELQSLMRISFA